MLRDEEGDASLSHALRVLGHHVVAHDLNVAAIGAQQELPDEVGLRVERDAVVDVGMLLEERLEDLYEMESEKTGVFDELYSQAVAAAQQ